MTTAEIDRQIAHLKNVRRTKLESIERRRQECEAITDEIARLFRLRQDQSIVSALTERVELEEWEMEGGAHA